MADGTVAEGTGAVSFYADRFFIWAHYGRQKISVLDRGERN
jgi:hypothetical protein